MPSINRRRLPFPEGERIFLWWAITPTPILQGDGANGKTLLVIGDSNAKLFAPWFTPYYETVYLVNGERYQNGAAGLQQIFMEYNVTDCVILEGADQFGETPLNQRMRSLGGGK